MRAFSLEEEIALVTGGGTGIGRAVAQCLAEAGARVVIAGRRPGVLEETARELGSRVRPMVFDVSDHAAAPEFVGRVTGEIGAPTVLVNNAGTHAKKPALDTSEEELQRLLDVHVVGAMALSRAVAPAMMERGRGSILFISSMAAVFGIPEVSAYSAAKSALLGVVRTLAVELSPSGVRVNAIAPGWIGTDLVDGVMAADPARKERILARTPAGRFGTPEDIGWAAVYLCSEVAGFVTGTQLVVDGGISIGF
jgi:gluconate 5-dehydrogenase